VLTSPTARILDLFCVIDEGESLSVVTLPGRVAETSKFLRSRIFFSDQVTVDDVSGDYAQILSFGPAVDDVLEKLGLRLPAPDHIVRWSLSNHSITVISQKILAAIGYRFLVPVAAFDALVAALDEAGAVSLDSQTFDVLRVEAGEPGPVGELMDAHTPLEVRLQESISDSKGCYTGQEIIARQITYDKVAKNLVGIRLNELVRVGAEIKTSGKSVGRLTSAVQSPRFGPIGLAVARRQYGQTGLGLSIVGADGVVASGEVVELPFR
jgi:folate-binding protein YgfZ